MFSKITLIGAAVLSFGLCLSMSPARAAPKPINVTVTGAGVKGYYKVIVDEMDSLLRQAYPGSAITFLPNSPAGGLALIARGGANISIAAGAPETLFAVEGHPPFSAPLRNKLTWVMRLHNVQPIYMLANKAWAKAHGVTSFADIARKHIGARMALNREGNMQITLIDEDILRSYGITVKKLRSWGGSVSWVASGVGLKELQDRKVDVFMNARFIPDATVKYVARTVGLTWVHASRAKLQKIANQWGYSVKYMPKSVYPTILSRNEPYINEWSGMLAGSKTSPELVYKLCRALLSKSGRDAMRKISPAMHNFGPKDVAVIPKVAPRLNPGARRCFASYGVTPVHQ